MLLLEIDFFPFFWNQRWKRGTREVFDCTSVYINSFHIHMVSDFYVGSSLIGL